MRGEDAVIQKQVHRGSRDDGRQNLLSVGGDGDKIILGSVLAGVLLFWPQGLVGLWRFARHAVVKRSRGVAEG
jgi:hypothetical protein